MATVTSRLNAAGDTTNTTAYTSASHTPAANELMVYFVEASACTDAAPTLADSLGEGTYTLLGQALYNTSGNSLYCFIGDQLTANSARTVTFTCSGASGATIGGAGVSGMTLLGSAALAQALVKQENQAATGTPAPTLGSSVTTTNPTLTAVGKTVQTTVTEPTGWSDISDNGHGTPNNRLVSAARDSGFTGTTITWGGTSDGLFASIAIELDASSAGGGGVSVTPTEAAAAGTVVAPTVILGSLTIGPAAAAAVGAVVAPTVQAGSLSLAPATATAKSDTVNPSVSVGGGGTTVSPATASASGIVVDPTVRLGSHSFAPGIATAVGAVAAPTVIIPGGGLVVDAGASEARGDTIGPTVVEAPGRKFGTTDEPLGPFWTPENKPSYSPWI